MATKKQTNIFQSVMPRTQTQKVVKEKASEYILVKSETLSDGTQILRQEGVDDLYLEAFEDANKEPSFKIAKPPGVAVRQFQKPQSKVVISSNPSTSMSVLKKSDGKTDSVGESSGDENAANQTASPQKSSQEGDSNAKEAEDDEEETIATFMTSAGQRLALYAVEDSDEIFAVALYTGKPPTDFQFLMKSDVERLISEGAVSTIKKKKVVTSPVAAAPTPKPAPPKPAVAKPTPPPPQPKPSPQKATQIITMPKQPPRYSTNYEDKMTVGQKVTKTQVTRTPNRTTQVARILPAPTRPMATSTPQTRVVYHAVQRPLHLPQHDRHINRYLMRVEPTTNVIHRNVVANVTTPIKREFVGKVHEEEIFEKSTVQNILFSEGQDESDLTFDDIQNYEKRLRAKPVYKKILSTPTSNVANGKYTSFTVTPTLQATAGTPVLAIKINAPMEVANAPVESPKPSTPSSALLKANLLSKSKTRNKNNVEVNKSLTSPPPPTSTVVSQRLPSPLGCSISEEDYGVETSEPAGKRSRKQRLHSMNRGDSEIIIQSAAMISEEEELPPLAPIRRKRKFGGRKGLPQRMKKTKIVKKPRKHKHVEVIDIDEDERGESSQTAGETATEDGAKEKGSSDKENDVILLPSSDEEESAKESVEKPAKKTTTTRLTCEHCSKAFRMRRTYNMHRRVCPGPDRGKDSTSEDDEGVNNPSTSGKRFSCKTCNEGFDVAVALARHVRSSHYVKKKVGRPRLSESSDKSYKPATPERPKSTRTSARKLQSKNVVKKVITPVKKSTKAKRIVVTANFAEWKVTKQFECGKCRRWLPSMVHLRAHLHSQHTTKKSAQKVFKCKVCSKATKSKVMYIKHMKLHKATKTSKIPVAVEKKKSQDSEPSQDPPKRKRGRPRKH